MRKLVLIIGSIFFLTGTLYSQVQFNPKGGVNFTSVSEDYEDGSIDGKMGYQFGFEVRIGDRFYVSPGLFYFSHQSQIEVIDEVDPEVILIDKDIDFSGLRIPLYIGGDLIEGENWGLRLYTGPNASLVLNSEDELTGFEDDPFRDVLWGVNAGLGVDLGIFTVDLSQEWRLNNVFDMESPEFKNNITHLSVGLLF